MKTPPVATCWVFSEPGMREMSRALATIFLCP